MSSLLERIRNQETRRSDARRSVLENLRRLCSTRLGSAPACPDYGVPDVIHYAATTADAIPGIVRALRAAILAAEPRLTGVRIEPVETEEQGYHFQVTAQIATGRRSRENVAFRTQLGPGHQLRIDE